MSILHRIDKFLLEKLGCDNKSKGWNLTSMKKYAKSLTGKDPTEHGWFDACVSKIQDHFDEPEKICASLRDSLLKTTKWRGKGKDIKKIVNQET